jgi:hypothetical protein
MQHPYLEDAAANLDFTLSEKERNSEEDVSCCISSGSGGDLSLLSTGHYFSGNKANLYQCLRLLGALETLMQFYQNRIQPITSEHPTYNQDEDRQDKK